MPLRRRQRIGRMGAGVAVVAGRVWETGAGTGVGTLRICTPTATNAREEAWLSSPVDSEVARSANGVILGSVVLFGTRPRAAPSAGPLGEGTGDGTTGIDPLVGLGRCGGNDGGCQLHERRHASPPDDGGRGHEPHGHVEHRNNQCDPVSSNKPTIDRHLDLQ